MQPVSNSKNVLKIKLLLLTYLTLILQQSVSAYGDGDDGFVPVDLPEYACSYCGLSDPACVVKCVDSSKW